MTNDLIPGYASGGMICAAGSEQAYIRMVSAIPMLEPEEELQLAHAYRFHEDLNAARKLIVSHLRFVVYIARSYRGYGLQLADLIQEGNIGLMKAVKRFDPEHGVRLVTFAVHWIRAEIHDYIVRNWRIVKVATTKAQRKLFFNLRKNRRELNWLSGSEVESMAADLKVKPETVREMEQRLTSKDVSFDSSVDDTDDGAVDMSPAGYLPDNRYNPLVLLENDSAEKDEARQLRHALDALDERSARIVRRRWLDDEKATLGDLADELGISAERVRQLEKQALGKIRQQIELAT